MFGKWLLGFLLPLALVAGLGACNGSSGAVQPGVVNTAAASGYRGETGRVVSIREVPIRSRNTGVSDGTLIGGGLGAAGGAAIGAATTNSVGGAVVGGVLGAVAGGIAGTAIDQNSTRRGIEVTVQKDNGQQVTIAQYDDGDVQMGDRVAIVYDSSGVPRVVRDTSGRRDY
jgi:outer membrane lipoprotein SlyB